MKKTCCVMAGLAIAGTGLISTAHSETIDDVLATAYNSNPTLMARRAQLRATDEGVPQALANWRPTVTLTGDLARGDYYSDQNVAPTNYDIFRTQKDYTGQISQPLYRGGRTVAATKQAEATVMATRAQLEATEAQVLLAAATAYLNVVRDDAVVKLSVNNQQVLRRQMEAAKERFRVGEITRTDVSQSEARLAQATADRVSAEGNLQSSRAGFIDVVGRAPESPQAPANAADVPGDFDTVKSSTLQFNPNIVAADWTTKAAKDGIDLSKVEWTAH